MTSITRETCANCGRERWRGTGGWVYQYLPDADAFGPDVPPCSFWLKSKKELPHNWQPAEQPEPERDVCVWTEDDRDGHWETECGNMFEFINDGPKENGTKYCCYCGKALEAG